MSQHRFRVGLLSADSDEVPLAGPVTLGGWKGDPLLDIHKAVDPVAIPLVRSDGQPWMVGAKMLAILPSQLRFDDARGGLAIAVETEALDAVPGIDRTNPPESAEDVLLNRAPTGTPQPAARGQGQNHG